MNEMLLRTYPVVHPTHHFGSIRASSTQPIIVIDISGQEDRKHGDHQDARDQPVIDRSPPLLFEPVIPFLHTTYTTT